VLERGELGVEDFTPERIADPDTLALAALVDGEGWAPGEAPARFAGRVRVRTRGGEELERGLDFPPGSPANPLAADAVAEKFRRNAALALGAEDAVAVEAAVLGLGEAADPGGSLVALSRAAAGSAAPRR
jgi:2-methylcitrate dehydratase PrpD